LSTRVPSDVGRAKARTLHRFEIATIAVLAQLSAASTEVCDGVRR